MPVTVASAERSSSELKLIKSYLRYTMSQDRLSGLSMISIESDVARELNYDELIQQFAEKKTRKKSFVYFFLIVFNINRLKIHYSIA